MYPRSQINRLVASNMFQSVKKLVPIEILMYVHLQNMNLYCIRDLKMISISFQHEQDISFAIMFYPHCHWGLRKTHLS